MSRGNVLVLLAHNDDEYFVSAAITRERAATNEVHILYTTHGSAYGVPTAVREAESTAALTRLGVSPTHIRHIGRECGIRDGTALENLLQLSKACRDAFPGVAFSGLLTVAWEGGHPDHDATYLIAAELAREWHLEQDLYEFPVYTQVGAPPPLFRTMRLIPGISNVGARVRSFGAFVGTGRISTAWSKASAKSSRSSLFDTAPTVVS